MQCPALQSSRCLRLGAIRGPSGANAQSALEFADAGMRDLETIIDTAARSPDYANQRAQREPAQRPPQAGHEAYINKRQWPIRRGGVRVQPRP